MSYTLVSDVAHTKPLTTVATTRPEVGVLLDASGSQVQALASDISGSGMHVSFALEHASPQSAMSIGDYGDQILPRLSDGGLFHWLHTRAELRRLLRAFGYGRHFLYASSGPSLGQWLFAHGEGGRLVAGAVKIDGTYPAGPLRLHAGEVIELKVDNIDAARAELHKIWRRLQLAHLRAVPVGRLISDAGVPL
jgi:hypothetical protein